MFKHVKRLATKYGKIYKNIAKFGLAPAILVRKIIIPENGGSDGVDTAIRFFIIIAAVLTSPVWVPILALLMAVTTLPLALFAAVLTTLTTPFTFVGALSLDILAGCVNIGQRGFQSSYARRPARDRQPESNDRHNSDNNRTQRQRQQQAYDERRPFLFENSGSHSAQSSNSFFQSREISSENLTSPIQRDFYRMWKAKARYCLENEILSTDDIESTSPSSLLLLTELTILGFLKVSAEKNSDHMVLTDGTIITEDNCPDQYKIIAKPIFELKKKYNSSEITSSMNKLNENSINRYTKANHNNQTDNQVVNFVSRHITGAAQRITQLNSFSEYMKKIFKDLTQELLLVSASEDRSPASRAGSFMV